MLKPWLYASVAPFFMSGITAFTTDECCLSGVRLSTMSAPGISSSYVPTLKPLLVALTYDARFESMADWRSVYDMSHPESRMFSPWFSPCAPQPTITIFLFAILEMPPANSLRAMNRHRPS